MDTQATKRINKIGALFPTDLKILQSGKSDFSKQFTYRISFSVKACNTVLIEIDYLFDLNLQI